MSTQIIPFPIIDIGDINNIMSTPSYGTVVIDGVTYLERWQIVPYQLNVTAALQNNPAIKIPLPGAYDFRLKALTRESVVNATGVSADNRFLCRIGNTDGAIWYAQGGVGGTTDLVIDSLMFGNGAFPYPVIPELFYGKNASIMMQFTDLGAGATPYTVNFAFHGAYLIPVGS